MTEYIERKAAIDAVAEAYYDTPDINLNESRLERAFVDNRNNFYTRHEAFMWTQQIGQLPETVLEYKKDHSENELYSEDLY